MFLYLLCETTFSIKFGIILKPVMSCKTSAKDVWNIMHVVGVVVTNIMKVKPQKWNPRIWKSVF